MTTAGSGRAVEFGPVRAGELELIDLGRGLTAADLVAEARALLAQVRALLADAVDQDVTFVPDDPQAVDAFATDPAEEHLAWTAGHVLVHMTASAEISSMHMMVRVPSLYTTLQWLRVRSGYRPALQCRGP